ncbi:MAG: globin [Acidimicrobiales bacterium]|nr:globin [Acidimicrobiales bacterium]
MSEGAGAGGEISVFDAVGGRPFFDALVERFYSGIEADPVLRPLYPADLSGSKQHLAGFLAQYWGGGTQHYSEGRGHPRLRMRHANWRIGPAERDAWYRHMEAAVRAAELPDEISVRLLDYFAMAATHLLNG